MKQMTFGLFISLAFAGCYSRINHPYVHASFPYVHGAPPIAKSSINPIPADLSSHDFQQIMQLVEQRRFNPSFTSLNEKISVTSEGNKTYRVVIDLYAGDLIAGSEIYVVTQSQQNKSWEITDSEFMVD